MSDVVVFGLGALSGAVDRLEDALQDAVRDIAERPTDVGEREVTLRVKIKPERKEVVHDGLLTMVNSPRIRCSVGTKMPAIGLPEIVGSMTDSGKLLVGVSPQGDLFTSAEESVEDDVDAEEDSAPAAAANVVGIGGGKV